ncbi:MAG TPA: symmetrical bis(5'-nucleosyl)-tetraphosphatase [Steroidobacteraceae bacterium]
MRYAIGDIQGCAEELRELLARLDFSPDRDELWFVGDLVNRGPRSLQALRDVRALGGNATVVLGNHDLHLLAVVFGARPVGRAGDTLDDVLEASDRDALIEWLLARPLAHFDAARRDLLVHAGLVPEWSVPKALALAGEVEAALQRDPRAFFANMYGDQPDRWRDELEGPERLRFVVNVLTRMRVCTADGRIDLKIKGPPAKAHKGFRPWFEHEHRASRDARIVFGHWSALGYVKAPGVLGLDTGCVWGGALTAQRLDADEPPVSVPCGGYRSPGAGADS